MMIFIKQLFHRVRVCALVCLAGISVSPLSAQNTLPAELRINGKTVWEAFESQREVLQTSSAVIYTDEGSRIMTIYGTVVSEDGYILTKASEIKDASKLTLRIGRELYREVQTLGVDSEWDVAMLKVEPKEPLTPINLSDLEEVKQGTWVISNGSTTRSRRRAKVGIMSANARTVSPPDQGVMMGVMLEEVEEKGLAIKKVTPDSGAEKAGLKEDDIIQSIEGKKIALRKELLELLKDKKAGDKIAVEVLRGDKQENLSVELMARPRGPERMSRNDHMSGGENSLSKRRTNFPRVLHHDTPLTKNRIGGPLLDLDGVCIGMNIARASRVATFAIPAPELAEIITRMKQ